MAKLTSAKIALFSASVAVPTAGVTASCQSYVAEKISPANIDVALTRLARLTPKSEFESTKAFEDRRAAADGGLDTLIIGKKPDDGGKHFHYDADRQVMEVHSYAFDNANFCKECIWGYGGPLYNPRDTAFRDDSLDVVISDTEKVLGSYVGTNAFGVKARIIKVAETVTAIYERPLSFGDRRFFAQEGPDELVGEIPMSPERARALKNAFKLAFVVAPKEPYTAVAVSYPSTLTINSPVERVTTTKVLFADIQCGLLTGPDDVVLAAYNIRD